MDSLSDIFNNSNNHDINNNPLNTPTLNESNYYLLPLDIILLNLIDYSRIAIIFYYQGFHLVIMKIIILMM